jgi:hypothetical protein
MHNALVLYFIFCGATVQMAHWPSRFDVSRQHNETHTAGRTPGNERSVHHRGSYLHDTQQTQPTNIHTFSGIRNRDSSNRAASDLGLGPTTFDIGS